MDSRYRSARWPKCPATQIPISHIHKRQFSHGEFLTFPPLALVWRAEHELPQEAEYQSVMLQKSFPVVSSLPPLSSQLSKFLGVCARLSASSSDGGGLHARLGRDETNVNSPILSNPPTLQKKEKRGENKTRVVFL